MGYWELLALGIVLNAGSILLTGEPFMIRIN
jgi:hypothetical protein